MVQGAEEFLELLSDQMKRPRQEREWAAFDELSEIAANFDLILDVNLPDARTRPLAEVGVLFSRLLSRQQPTGGMAEKVNPTLVGQFRMPGYPFVLISTDLLQEGEDLHTFCSSVHHYGISWTPSSVEQRIGRIDRVRSQTDRRLSQLNRDVLAEEKLQVYYPFLQDTIEVVQVQRVLARVNTFLRLMHEGLLLPGGEERKVDLTREMATEHREVAPILKLLCSAFAVRQEHLQGGNQTLAVTALASVKARESFRALPLTGLKGEFQWEEMAHPEQLFGTAKLDNRQQPFTLVLRSFAGQILIHCVSPVGRVFLQNGDAIAQATATAPGLRLGAIVTEQDGVYDLVVEGEVMLPGDEVTGAARVGWLVRNVTAAADVLEQAYLPGKDEPLATFKADLEKERRRDD